MQDISGFPSINNDILDSLILQYFDCHNRKIGSALVIDSGYMRSLVLHVQRSQIRKSLLRLDPKNNSLKWGTVTIQKKNFGPWSNSLWHFDGHHYLRPWNFLIHGVINRYSRRVVFLECSDNSNPKLC